VNCPSETRALAFVEGAVSVAERAELTAHLDECADCRELFAALLGQSQLFSVAPGGDVDEVRPDDEPPILTPQPIPRSSARSVPWVALPFVLLVPVVAMFVGIELRTFVVNWRTSNAPTDPVTLECRAPLGRIRGGTYVAGPTTPAVSGDDACEVTLEGATIRGKGIFPAVTAGGSSRIHLVKCHIVGTIELLGDGRVDVVPE
jgi:anti-sigma factor RsiW